MIWTATSVFPVPGGPTTRVSPGCIPERMASTWVEVKGTVFLGEMVRGRGEKVQVNQRRDKEKYSKN